MSVLRGKDIGVDADAGLGEELPEGAKLVVGIRTRPELRRRLDGERRAASDDQRRGFGRESEEFGAGLGFEENGEESEAARGVGGRRRQRKRRRVREGTYCLRRQ